MSVVRRRKKKIRRKNNFFLLPERKPNEVAYKKPIKIFLDFTRKKETRKKPKEKFSRFYQKENLMKLLTKDPLKFFVFTCLLTLDKKIWLLGQL